MPWSIRRLLKRPFTRRRSAPVRRARLGLEALEGREVPANLSVSSIAFVNGAGDELSSVAVGQLARVKVNYQYQGITQPTIFHSHVSMNGVTNEALSAVPLGAGTGSFTLDGYVVKSGTNSVYVK